MKKEKIFFGKVKLLIFLSIFSFFVLSNFLFVNRVVIAGPAGISVSDWKAQNEQMKQLAGDEAKLNWEKALDKAWKALKTAGSKALGTAVRTTLKQVAYDSAVYLSSGGEGQKPLFFKEGWGEFLPNVMDSAAGTFIEALGRSGEFGATFNLCEPSFGIKYNIGLGLEKQRRPSAPSCTWTKLKNNWSSDADKWAAMGRDDFLKTFQNSFDPASSDFGVALTLQGDMTRFMENEGKFDELDRIESEGWLDLRGIDKVRKTFPGEEKIEAQMIHESWAQNMALYTGDALVDAANVFMNQFAYELIKRLMRNLTDNATKITSPGKSMSWSNADAGPYNSGIEGAKEQFRRVIEPNFNERGDYDILAELTLCPNPTKAGPTNCVITSDFQQAVTDMMTVGEAVKVGYLNGNGVFGFSSNGLEPKYQEGYPYRSMLILRKFRILPVGWEVAAQYAKDNMTLLGGAKNLRDMLACYENGDGDGFGTFFNAGCVGLVDPNWVLKAPQNYCKREGPGPEILTETVTGKGEDSELLVSRNENYCADEQACIEEDDNGVCRAYGYCTEEKRVWRFDSDTCEPIYNSCETFSGSEGQSLSYLKNTLDYGDCNIDSVGCNDYCEEYDFDDEEYNCTATSGVKVYLNGKTEECDSDEEGCHEFIRFKPGLGANYLQNSSFEDMAGVVDIAPDDSFGKWGIVGEAVSDAYHGRYGLQLSSNFSTTTIVGPATFSVAGKSYVLSFYAKDCAFGDFVELGNSSTTLQSGGDWHFYQTNYNYPASAFQNDVTFTINTSNCIVDALKLESGVRATVYSDYRGAGLVYQKLAPDYLSCSGTSDPFECNDYVRRCSELELDCGLYTAVTDGIQIPGKVSNENYCPSDCVGYDDYFQTETNFDSGRLAYIIPAREQACSAEVVGCDEFTNLDELDQGAEEREFYSEIRHCRNPDGECAEFYTWEGSSETGFQLKVFSLELDDDTNDLTLPDPGARYIGDAAVTEYDYADCNPDIYNLPPTDPGYNSDCREFYNTEGDISYHLYARTITCSDNCHPYRRTDQNIVKDNLNNNLTLAACNALSPSDPDAINYDGTQCFFCKNGGEWDSGHNACIYMAVPYEGEMCRESSVGCREYSGKTGGNMRIIFNHDFERGDTQSWEGDLGSPSLSSDSLIAGGRSLSIQGGAMTAELELGTLFNKNSSYVVSFIAKGNGGDLMSIRIGSSTAEMIEFPITSPSTDLTADWKLYEFNLDKLNNLLLDYEVGIEDKLFIEANVDFLVDNIRLTEIVDRYYFVKQDYWNVPEICEYDVFGVWQGSEYNLGCEEYTDEDKEEHYLKGFSSLCSDSAIGCELVIDTQNYSDPEAGIWHELDASEESVSADQFAYVVYNKEKLCDLEDKGCQKLGNPEHYLDNVFYEDIYLKNNPDVYDSTLCQENQEGCELWYKTDGETTTFKNPDNMVCEYRLEADEGENAWDWFMRKMYYCDTTMPADGLIDHTLENEFCSVGKGCAIGDCILDTNDILCPQIDKTFGIGGVGNQTTQPHASNIDGVIYPWAGACPANESTCTEYIDPISTYSSNELFNPDCTNLDNNPVGFTTDCNDGWEASGLDFIQTVYLKPFTLYTLTLYGSLNTATITRSDSANMQALLSDNTLGEQAALTVTGTGSVLFYGVGGEHVVTRTDNSDEIILKKTVISYRKEIEQENDCNGNINYANGCIMFNKREVTGGGNSLVRYKVNNWDVDLTLNSFPNLVPLEFSPEILGWENDSNELLKVRPDRICAEWLACRSFIKDSAGKNVCYDIGLCDNMDEKGVCGSFVNEGVAWSHEVGSNLGQYSNVTGYSKVGKIGVVDDDMAGMYTFSNMNQEGSMALVPNGGFEIVGDNHYPLGWVTMDNIGNVVEWEKSGIKIVDNPISAQEEGLGKAPEGRNFLKVGSIYRAVSENIGVIANTQYFISAKINTLKLSRGTAYLRVVSGNLSVGTLSLEAGNVWTTVTLNFIPNEELVSIYLYAAEGGGIDPVGNFFYDEIKIEPVLKIRADTYKPKTCRLYPKNDSLSCDQITGSGVKERGWQGYCLEHDRFPGNEDSCLMWWPVDRVKGEAVDEGGGYIGQYPLYYCQNAVANRPVERRVRRSSGTLFWGSCNAGCASQPYNCPLGYRRVVQVTSAGICPDSGSLDGVPVIGTTGTPGTDSQCIPHCVAVGSSYLSSGIYGWYDYTGDIMRATDVVAPRIDIRIQAESGVKFYNDSRNEVSENPAECHQLTQVVTPSGQNKFWSGRVYEGSDYRTRRLGYEYIMPNIPFGAMMPPDPLSNPFEWSQITKKPLPIILSDNVVTEANAGNPYALSGRISFSSGLANSRFGICSLSRRICLTPVLASSPLACGAGETCDNFTVRSADAARGDIQRIFAKNYGTWVWDRTFMRYNLTNSITSSGSGVCSDNNTVSCYYDECGSGFDCELGGSVLTCASGPLMGESCSECSEACLEEEVTFSNFVCSEDTTLTCCPLTSTVETIESCLAEVECVLKYDGTYRCADDSAGSEAYCNPSSPGRGFVCVGGAVNNGAIVRTSSCAGTCEMAVGEFSYTYNICDIAPPRDDLPVQFCCGTGIACEGEYVCNGGVNNGDSCYECQGAGNCDIPAATVDSNSWDPVTILCPGGIRAVEENCAIRPTIERLRIDGEEDLLTIRGGYKFVNLTFNSDVDENQLPLVMYSVSWGDGSDTVLSGSEMFDRPDEDYPHSLYYLYDFWDMKNKMTECAPAVDCTNYDPDDGTNCCNDSCCVVTPEIILKDNWACINNGGAAIASCRVGERDAGPSIVVYE